MRLKRFAFAVALLAAATIRGTASTPDSAPATGLSEPDYEVIFWNTAQGLPHNTVNALLQTQDGYLWVGTAAGLASFDGLVFTTLGADTAAGLKDTTITSLLEDTRGALWVGTQGKGVLRLRRGPPEWFTTAQGLANDSVTSLAEDTAGRIWIGTQAGLNNYEKNRLDTFSSPVVPPADGVIALHAGRSGTLWVTTRSGVFRLEGGQATAFQSDDLPQGHKGEFLGAYEDRSGNLWAFGATFLINLTQGGRLNNPPPTELASSRVWTICEQSAGTFWIGTSGRRLFRFENGRFEMVGERAGLDQCEVRALHADRWGNLWIGTNEKGLARLRARRIKFVRAADGLDTHKLAAIAPDPAGGLWLGTADAGLLRWDGRQIQPATNGPPLDLISQVQSLGVDARGSLWAGTWGMGLIELNPDGQRRYTTADGLSSDVVLALAPDPTNGVWAGTQAGILHRIQDNHLETIYAGELAGSPILCLLPRAGGQMLIGAQSGALMFWDGQRLAPFPAPAKISGHPVRCLYEDRKGRLWLGAWGAGAFCRHGDSWVELSAAQGLGSDTVAQITQDDSGDFWFGTEDNLSKVTAGQIEALLNGTRQTVACVPVAPESGFEDLKCPAGWPTVARTTRGATWLATSAGLFPLGPREHTLSEPPPPVILEQILINGLPGTLPNAATLRLGPRTRSLDFVFTAISFTAPQKLRFRHKLENFDPDWVQGDVARRAHYGPLPPGSYKFRVIAGNAEGQWNELGASLAIIIVPPIWRAWWFLTSLGSLTVILIWAVARYISVRRLQASLLAAEQRHAMDRERARIARDMHDEIGSKLTRISFLSEVVRHAGAQAPEVAPPVKAIADTSRELLQALDEIVWAVNPQNDNLEQLAGYLEQHAREYFQSTSLECRIQVPPQLPPVPLSAELRHNVFLAFEEALNNTLKHAQASHLQITMNLEARAFRIELRDDGKGFTTTQAPRAGQDGLRNMRARLATIGGDCEVVSKAGSGTTVTLRFPLQ